MTTVEASRLLGITPQGILYLLNSGQALLPCIRKPNCVLLKSETVWAYREARIRSGNEVPPLTNDNGKGSDGYATD